MIVFLLIIIIIILIIKINKKDQDNTNNVKNYDDNNRVEISNNDSPISYKKYYKPKIYITTLNEMKFYNVLLEIAKELDYILFFTSILI